MSYDLAKSLDDVDWYLRGENEYKRMGVDVETTSLNTRKAALVGISLSLWKGTGIYIPTGHRLGTNLPIAPTIERIKRKTEEGYVAVYFNAKFDRNIKQARAGWVPKKFEDVLEYVYLANPDRKRKDLKTLAKEDLGEDMAKFESLFTPEEQRAKIFDISTKSPARCKDYAAADADMTLRLWEKYRYVREENEFACKVDHALIEIVRRLEHNGGMELNNTYITEQVIRLEKLTIALQEQIFRMTGGRFEINSPKQLGDVLFERMGIPSPGLTRGVNPQHKTDAETLEKLSQTYPVVEFIISYRKVIKAKSSYFLKLRRVGEMGIPVRFSFHMFSAPTFRFAAPGGDPEKDGSCGVNIQAVSNGEARDIVGVDLRQESEDDNTRTLDTDELLVKPLKDKTMKIPWGGVVSSLPWVLQSEDEDGHHVCFRETCQGCPAWCESKGIDVTRRRQKGVKMVPSVRQAFQAPDGYTLLSFDYERQELVIGANVSGEPKWLRALGAGEDLHEQTAAEAFGQPVSIFRKLAKEEYKRKRDDGKTLNFAIFFGATAYTIARKANIAQAAAEQLFDNFVKGHPTLMSWINKVHLFSRKNGYTTTYFGRKRWLKQFYDSPDKKMRAFADRSAVNTCIQGTGAEITRIAMVKVQHALEKKDYGNKDVRLVMQLHDELTYMIRIPVVKEAARLIRDNMEFKVKSWTVQLTVGCKMGKVWGSQEPLEIPRAN